MGWFGGGLPAKVGPVEVSNENQQFLEDLPPKFDDSLPRPMPPGEAPATLADAARQFKFSDWSFERLIGIPCFREAALTGFQAMGVLGIVTLVVHKNPARLANWGIWGFFLGSVVGWEQCRSIRRKQFKMMEEARKANRNNPKKAFVPEVQKRDPSARQEDVEKK